MNVQDKHFYLNGVFPNVQDIFTKRCREVEFSSACWVALDANVLLSPYRLGATSLEAVKTAFAKIAEDKRFIIPAHAVREFGKNRCKYILESMQSVLDDSSIAKTPRSKSYEGLAENPDYKKSEEAVNRIKNEISGYREHIDRIVSTLRHRLYEADPILDIYAGSLLPYIYELDIVGERLEMFKKDLVFRNSMSIPPGFKDEKKADQGAGDLIIWKTILQQCAGSKKDLIFVTNEEKPDWYVIGAGQKFPRVELIEEYRTVSEGGSLRLADLSELLKGFEVEATIVQEVARTQINAANQNAGADKSADALQERMIEIENEMQILRHHVANISTDFNDSLSLPWNKAAYGARAKLASLQKQYEILKGEFTAKTI